MDPALTWIGKETSLAAKAGPVVIDPDDELEVIDPSISEYTDPVAHSGSSGSSSNPAPDEDVDEANEVRELS